MDLIQIILLLTSNHPCTVINGFGGQNTFPAYLSVGQIHVDFTFLATLDLKSRHEWMSLDSLFCGIFLTSMEKVKKIM